MPNVERGAAVDKNALQYDKDGRVIDPKRIQELIFRGASIFYLLLLAISTSKMRVCLQTGCSSKFESGIVEVFTRLP
jgi:hypothetical protein